MLLDLDLVHVTTPDVQIPQHPRDDDHFLSQSFLKKHMKYWKFRQKSSWMYFLVIHSTNSWEPVSPVLCWEQQIVLDFKLFTNVDSVRFLICSAVCIRQPPRPSSMCDQLSDSTAEGRSTGIV